MFSLYIRRHGVCEFAGQDGMACSPQLQNMHIKSRRYSCTRWSTWNCCCGCAAHHRFYTNHPDLFTRVIDRLWPGRLDYVQQIWLEGEKPDRQALYDWLKEELAKLK